MPEPSDGAKLKAGKVTVQGAAWAGEADIVKVESPPMVARPGVPQDSAMTIALCVRLWSYDWKPGKAGDYTIQARANRQPGTHPARDTFMESKRLSLQRHRPGEDHVS